MRVGPTDDSYEREAHAVAAAVVDRLASGAGEVGAPQILAAVPSVGTVRRSEDPSAAGDSGGPLGTDTAARIERLSGRGLPLAASTRQTMESAFGGANFGGVRVHGGAESRRLNTELRASAFTVGKDIFFRDGVPSATSPNGQAILAHELTHTLQDGSHARRTVRRLAFDNPDFSKVTRIKQMGAGASGKVLIVDDGSGPLIVKADQSNPAEVLINDQLRQGMKSGGKGRSKTRVNAQVSRLEKPGERKALRDQLLDQYESVETRKDPSAKGTDPRAEHAGTMRELLDALAKGAKPMIVAKLGEGRNLADIALEADTDADDGTTGEQSLNMLGGLASDSGALATIGRIATTDIATGMFDRLAGSVNMENLMYNDSSKTFFMPDNTQGSSLGYLVARANDPQDLKSMYDDWASNEWVMDLAHRPKALATRVVDNFINGLTQYMALTKNPSSGKTRSRPGKAGQATANAFRDFLEPQKAQLEAAVGKGIKKGTAEVVAKLRKPASLVSGIPEGLRQEAATSLLARAYVIEGMDKDKAWMAAITKAQKLFPAAKVKKPKPTRMQAYNSLKQDLNLA